jgi:hypothetical protein
LNVKEKFETALGSIQASSETVDPRNGKESIVEEPIKCRKRDEIKK